MSIYIKRRLSFQEGNYMFRHNVLESFNIVIKKGRLYNELNVCYNLIKIYMFDTEIVDFQLLVQNKNYIQ